MAFIFIPVEKIRVKIDITIPGDLGKTQKAEFIATFDKLSVSERKALTEQIKKGDLIDDDVLALHCKNIEGVQDDKGEAIPFSGELLTGLLDLAYVREPLVEAFYGQLYGNDFVKRLKEKN